MTQVFRELCDMTQEFRELHGFTQEFLKFVVALRTFVELI
jgi:hypothetical protein